MDDGDLERLLGRYRPADPSPQLRERVRRRRDVEERTRRISPWALAAAALLALTIGLHAATVAGPEPRPAPDPAPLAEQLGGDESAYVIARFTLATTPSAPRQEASALEIPWTR